MIINIPITPTVMVSVDSISGEGFDQLLKYWIHKLNKHAHSFSLRGHAIEDNKHMLIAELFFCLRRRFECPKCKHLSCETDTTNIITCEECKEPFDITALPAHGGWDPSRGCFNTYAWTCLRNKVAIWLNREKMERNVATSDKLYTLYRCPHCQMINDDVEGKEITCLACDQVFVKTPQLREHNKGMNEVSLFVTSIDDNTHETLTENKVLAIDEKPIVFIDEYTFVYNKQVMIDMRKILNEREIKIIQMRFGLNDTDEHNLAEISQKLHIYRHSTTRKDADGNPAESKHLGERIRQLEAVALKKLRKALVTAQIY